MLDRSIAPEVKPLNFKSPQLPQRITLENGVIVYALAANNMQVVHLNLDFKLTHNISSPAGLGSIAFRLLQEGAANLNSSQIADEFEFLGASVEFSVGLDAASINIYCLSEKLIDVLKLVKKVVYEPTFPEKEFGIIKQNSYQQILINQKKTSFIAGNTFRNKLFGNQHPYGKIVNLDNLLNFTIEDSRNWYLNQIGNTVPEVFVTGFFDLGEISEELRSWLVNGSTISKNNSEFVPQISEGHHDARVEGADLQSTICLGGFSLTPHQPNYSYFRLAVEIFGGYFGSRLMKNIREEKGLTYGIHSRINNSKLASYLVVSSDCNAQKASLVVEEINKEFLDLAENLVSDEELAVVKNYMLGQYLSSLNNPFGHMEKFKFTHGLNLPETFIGTHWDKILSANPTQIRDSVVDFLHQEKRVTIIAGNNPAQ